MKLIPELWEKRQFADEAGFRCDRTDVGFRETHRCCIDNYEVEVFPILRTLRKKA